jgi:hypothetical protein
VPLGLAIAVLVLELGLVARSRGALRAALWLPAGLVMLAVAGERPDDLYQGFLNILSDRLGGTPFYLTLMAAAGFYAYGWCRRVPRSELALVAALAVLAVVAPLTRNLGGLVAPRPAPLLAIAALELGLGLRRWRSERCLSGAVCLWAAALAGLSGHLDRALVVFHLAMVSTLVLGALFDDGLGQLLRLAAVGLVLLGCLVVLTGQRETLGVTPFWVRAGYVSTAAAVLGGYGWLLKLRIARAGAVVAVAGWLFTLGWESYTALRRLIAGLDFIATGLFLLGLAELTSVVKAGLVRCPAVKRRPGVPTSLD